MEVSYRVIVIPLDVEEHLQAIIHRGQGIKSRPGCWRDQWLREMSQKLRGNARQLDETCEWFIPRNMFILKTLMNCLAFLVICSMLEYIVFNVECFETMWYIESILAAVVWSCSYIVWELRNQRGLWSWYHNVDPKLIRNTWSFQPLKIISSWITIRLTVIS